LAAELLRRWLAHPLTAALADDDPKTTDLRKQIIQSKPFLKAIYEEWYERLAAEVPRGTGGVLELGSGAGFRELHPRIDYFGSLLLSEHQRGFERAKYADGRCIAAGDCDDRRTASHAECAQILCRGRAVFTEWREDIDD